MDKKPATETHLKSVQRWTEAVEAREYEDALSILQEAILFADENANSQMAKHLRELEGLTQGWLAYGDDQQVLGQIRESYERRLACSFCGKKRSEVAIMVAGPQVYICSGCITALSGREGHTPSSLEAICSFCGKQVSEVERLIQASGASVCDGCLGVCVEILEETRNT